MEDALGDFQDVEVELDSGERLCYLGYSDDIICLFKSE